MRSYTSGNPARVGTALSSVNSGARLGSRMLTRSSGSNAGPSQGANAYSSISAVWIRSDSRGDFAMAAAALFYDVDAVLCAVQVLAVELPR